ncbi:DUF1648 domain-containing protein [Microbacterium sp. KR10-403]|uniref:DUF1648 domain-containing protein n=1 Tax=Microbacterium sp. KR10-403 TaxID=3158581 RepID=UPI0032E40808
MTPDVRAARRAFLWVGVIVPVVITLLSATVIAIWLPQLPDPAATHWSGGGGPDGFGPAWTYLVIGLAVPLGLVALFAVMALFSHRMPPRDPEGPQWSSTARFLGAMSLGVSVMMAITMPASVGVQRGLADAADAPDVTGWMLAGFAAAAATTVLGWFLQPAVAATAGSNAAVAPLPLAPGERAVWTSSATTGRAGVTTLTVSLLVLVATAVVLWSLDVPSWWILALVCVILCVLMLTMLSFRVRVDAAGLLVRSTAGWPRFRIRPEEIAGVREITVHPFAEFGGWGVRLGTDGRFGVVLRTGDAIEVTRRSGRIFVVTVDDASTGAALLEAVRTGATQHRG